MSTAPRLLILETSGRPGQVAVAEGAAIKGSRRLDEARRHARDLAPAVAAILAEQKWKARALDAVIVSLGPGSYTGLRVGLMSAKTLAYATGCALIGVETFRAVARQAPPDVLDVEVLADAQQDKIYWQRFRRPEAAADFLPLGPLQIRKVADWLRERDPLTWISGPWLQEHAERLPGELRLVAEEFRQPRVENLLELGLARYVAGERDDPWLLEPLYLRPSSAEEKWAVRPLSQP